MNLRVFVTGANRGLGLEMVRQYIEQGATVFAAARTPQAGELGRLVEKHGETLLPIKLDVTSDQEIAEAVDAVRTQAGALDLLINNAAINLRAIELGKYAREAMLDAMNVNAVAPILVAQALLGLLRQGRTPKIVNISTQNGSFAWNREGSSPLYAASKAALNMFTRALAREAEGVITIAVHPGWVQTDMGGKQAPLLPVESVRHLRALIARLTPADNGQFFNYDGKPHPF
jgi:NAD(P)-dependent dehydrogenase (short-subunit alcohol dehydrogenase family)